MSRLHLNLPESAESSHREPISSTPRAGWAHLSERVARLEKASVRRVWCQEKRLGVEHLEQAMRLACQVKIENHGEVVVQVTSRPQTRAAQSDDEELKQKFGALPLSKKIAMLMQFETITASEAFDTAIEKPLAYGTKAFDSIMNRARAKSESKK